MEQLNLNWKQVGKKNHMMTCLKFESQTYLGQRFAIFLNDNIVATRLPLNALQDILCLNLRPSWILTSWGIGRHGWKSNHTYNEGTNLWAVRMSVQVHKLTNLKNGIESHTSSWEMWRQQIWLLNNLEYQTKQVRSVTVTCCQAGLGYCNYMKQKTQDTRLLSHISHKFFCTPYPPSLVRFLLPSHRRPLQPMPPESIPSIEKKSTLPDHEMSLTESTLSVLVQ